MGGSFACQWDKLPKWAGGPKPRGSSFEKQTTEKNRWQKPDLFFLNMNFYLFWLEFERVGRVEKQSDWIQWRGLVPPCVLHQEVSRCHKSPPPPPLSLLFLLMYFLFLMFSNLSSELHCNFFEAFFCCFNLLKKLKAEKKAGLKILPIRMGLFFFFQQRLKNTIQKYKQALNIAPKSIWNTEKKSQKEREREREK